MKGLLFTYALTYGGAVVALFNPFYGLLVYISFAILRPESLWPWSVPPGNYSRIVAIAMLIGWAMHGFGNWNFRGAKPILTAILGYAACLVVSAMFAEYQEVAWNFVEKQLKIVLPFVVGMTLVDSIAKLKTTAWVILVSQAYVTLQLNLNYLNGYYPVAADIRFSFFDNNGLGIVNATGAGLAFFLGRAESVWWRRWGAFAAAALMVHVPMFCMSRGGILGVIVLGAASFWILPKRPKDYLLFALAIAFALRLAGPPVWERFSTAFGEAGEKDNSVQERLQLWRTAREIMLVHPLTGLGPAQFSPHAHEYGFPHGKAMHNTWMSTGAELGFPGLFCLAGFYTIAVFRLRRLLRRTSLDPWLANASRMVIASIGGFAASASFVSVEGVELPYYIVLLGVGALRLAEQNAYDVAGSTERAAFYDARLMVSSQ